MQNFGRQIRCIMGDVQVAYVQSCCFVYQTFWSCHCHCHCHYHCIRSLIVPSNNKCFFFFSKLKSAPRQLKWIDSDWSYCKLLLTCSSPGFMHLCKARVWEGLINRGRLITEGERKSNSSSARHTFCIYRLLLKLQSIITYPFHSKQARGGLTNRCIFWFHVEGHEKGHSVVVSLFRIQATETSLEYKHNFLQCKRTCRRTSWSSLIFERVENTTFLITSLASCRGCCEN